MNLGIALHLLLLTLLENDLLGPKLVIGDILVVTDTLLLDSAMGESSGLALAPRVGRSVLTDSEAIGEATIKTLDHGVGFIFPIEVDRNRTIFLGVYARAVLMPELAGVSATECVQISAGSVGYEGVMLPTSDEADIAIIKLLDASWNGVCIFFSFTSNSGGFRLRGVMKSLAELAIIANAHAVHDVTATGVLGAVLSDNYEGVVKSTANIDNAALVDTIAGLAKLDLSWHEEDVLDEIAVVVARVVADLGGWAAHLSGLSEAPAPQSAVLEDGQHGRGSARNLDGLLRQAIDLNREPLNAPRRSFWRTAFLLVVGRAKVDLPRNPGILGMDDAPPLFAIPITVGTPPVDVAVRGQGSAVAVSSSDSNDLSVGTVEKGDAIGNGGWKEALDEIGHPTRIDLAGRAGNGVV